jgi:hypothetical protein
MRLFLRYIMSAYCLPFSVSITKLDSNSAEMFNPLFSLFRKISYSLRTIIFGFVVRLHFLLGVEMAKYVDHRSS